MTEKAEVPAIEGWYTMDSASPRLLGARCDGCGTYYFPKQVSFCRNPDCDSDVFREVELSRTGKIWSYTNACYKPPSPYVATEPFEPFSIAAVELEQEKMIILGQLTGVEEGTPLTIGTPVELVLEPLHEDDAKIAMIWKWRPTTEQVKG